MQQIICKEEKEKKKENKKDLKTIQIIITKMSYKTSQLMLEVVETVEGSSFRK